MRSRNLIIPGCLVLRDEDFVERLEFARQVGNAIHIDVIDDKFVRGHTLPVADWPVLEIAYAEAHLMVCQPMEFLATVKAAGATRALVHIESEFDLDKLAETARRLDLLLGWAVSPDTDLSTVKRFLTISNYVLIMGVFPGRTGQAQLPQTISAVSYFESLLGHRLIISVDGGVAGYNIGSLRQAGADYFVVSAALYDHGAWSENYLSLAKKLANDYQRA